MSNQSRNFKDKFNEVLSEAHLGPGTSMPGGISTWNTNSNSKTRGGQNPPFSLYSADTGKPTTGTGINEQPPEETEAPKISPFPLEYVGEFLSNGYMNIHDVKELIKKSYNNPMLSPAKIKVIKDAEKRLEKILEEIKEIGDNVLNVRLSV
jgi:hypothetical protein